MTTTPSVWDDPDIRAGGEFVKLEAVGDSIAGTITGLRTQRWDNGKVDPQILLTTDDGEDRTLTAGQIRLKAELAEQRPEVGDHLKIVLTDIEKRGGGKTLKHFDVEIQRGKGDRSDAGGLAAPTVPPAATAAVNGSAGLTAAAVDPAAAAAALANLTDEQKKALGLPPF